LDYEDGTIDYIYTSNMLEHFDEINGLQFLKEGFRVLKKGGILRIIIPDIDKLIQVYLNWDTANETDSIYGTIQFYKNDWNIKDSVNFFNQFTVQEVLAPYGHRFYYNVENLRNKCKNIGFTKIKSFDQGNVTEHIVFENMDLHYGYHKDKACMYVEITK